jgi:IclR family acetate operon transcriptional repressor
MSSVQSIERAFTVLEALRDGPLGVTGIAERVELPKSTVARLLAALAAEGAVEQRTGSTDYRIGGRLASLAAGGASSLSLIALARPHLIALTAATGEAAGLSIPDGDLMHYVDQEDSPHPVAIRDWTGTRYPMHAVSAGLVVLANRHPDQVDAYLATPLEALTPETVTDPRALRERMARARADGFAWTRNESAEGISSVAAAVADRLGEVVGAVHVHGPSYRFPSPDAPAAAKAAEAGVVAAAAAISANLRRAG